MSEHHHPSLRESAIAPRRAALLAASALLAYPDGALASATGEIRRVLRADHRSMLQPLFGHLEKGDLIDLQEFYVATFDRHAAHSLHMFEHVHGESRDRGQALIDLRREYLDHGLIPDTNELPDYIPLFLEFLGQIPPDEAQQLLDEAIHILARVGGKLAKSQNPYAAVFAMLGTLSTVQPESLPEPEEGDFEEKPVTFGPDTRGRNPADALARAAGGGQGVTFYARDGKPRTFSGARAPGRQ